MEHELHDLCCLGVSEGEFDVKPQEEGLEDGKDVDNPFLSHCVVFHVSQPKYNEKYVIDDDLQIEKDSMEDASCFGLP